MRRTLSRLLGIFFAVCASALMLAAVGCSSGNAGSPTPYLPGNLPEAGGTRDIGPGPQQTLAIENSASPAATSDWLSSGGAAARDLDIGGGSTGGGPLTLQSLGATLQSMGLSPQEQGGGYCVVAHDTINGSGYTIPIYLCVSSNQQWICIWCNVGPARSTSPQVLANLLAANAKIAPCAFEIDNDTVQLYLGVPNEHLGQDALRSDLKFFYGEFKGTMPCWNTDQSNGGGGTISPPQQSQAPLVYSGTGLSVEIDSVSGGTVNGVISIGDQKCPFGATYDGQAIRGTCVYGNNQCPFVMTVRGRVMYMDFVNVHWVLPQISGAP